MLRNSLLATTVLCFVLAVACRDDPGDGDEDSGPGRWCEGVECSGHGTCQEDDERGWCECEAGYVAVRWDCVLLPSDGDADTEADGDAPVDADAPMDADEPIDADGEG